MFRLDKLKLTQIFAILISLFIFGFVFYGVWSFKTLNELKVNGPIYQRIAQNKDLVADILPPPEYILESYLTVLRLEDEPDNGEQRKLIRKLEVLRAEYFDRHAFWEQQGLDMNLENVFIKRSYDSAKLFYEIAFNRFIPSLQNKDEAAIETTLAELNVAYETHRKAIDEVVKIANNNAALIESSAKEDIESATILMLLILAASMVTGIGIAAIAKNSLIKQLGAEPSALSDASKKIAEGNLDIELPLSPTDNMSVMYQIDQMRQQLKLRIKEELSDERAKTHHSTLLASEHYLNNALNQFQLILLTLESSGSVDQELLSQIKESIFKTAKEMKEFGQLENPTRENVQKFISERL